MNLKNIYGRFLALALVVLAVLLVAPNAEGRTKEKKKGESGKTQEGGGKLNRVPTSQFESIQNKGSNVQFYSTNYGIFGNNVAQSVAGGIWPRGSGNAYIFGGGIWFGAKKRVNGVLTALSEIGYDPNSGASWFVPGRIEDADVNINKNRIYFSTDYDPATGKPLDKKDVLQGGPYWPVWDDIVGDTLKHSHYFGHYVDDVSQRNTTTYPKGPAIISREDIFSTYNDKDITRFEAQQKPGHPLGLQIEQTIYSWDFGSVQSPNAPVASIRSPYRDMIFLRYVIINRSSDTLTDCYMAPACDMDIGAAANDRARIAIADKANDSLNLAVQWSDAEAGKTFGYIGFDFLESPAVDSAHFMRHDKKFYTQKDQIGLSTFQSWTIDEDPKSSGERYNFMSAGDRDVDVASGDKRFLTATGPFNLAPGDTARVVVGIVFAYSASGVTPTGNWPDLAKLIAVDQFAQKVYDNNFLAPTPPDQALLSWKPLKNGVELSWDEESERSTDLLEGGLDFKGYILQRERAGSGKFTPTDTVSGWGLGWKTIARFDLPSIPDSATRYEAARTHNSGLLGPWHVLPQLADTCAAKGLLDSNPRYRWDTLSRPVLGDTLVRGPKYATATPVFCLSFDPYNDADSVTNLAVRNAIVAIMDSITQGRRYVDVGDDNNDGLIDAQPNDLTKNEKLLNNVDYYYQLLAFDEGSKLEGTDPKLNGGRFGQNYVLARPEAPTPGVAPTPVTIAQNNLGGIQNFRLDVFDKDRLGQMFGGDTLEFDFRPVNDLYYYYTTEVIGKSRRTGKTFMDFLVNYSIDKLLKFTDRTGVDLSHLITATDQVRLVDTNLISGWRPKMDSLGNVPLNSKGQPLDSIFVTRTLSIPFVGTFVPDAGAPVYGTVGIYKETFAVDFDFNFLQFSDSLRFGDSAGVAGAFNRSGGSNTNLIPRKQFLGNLANAKTPFYPIPSIGQVKLGVEFTHGGTETITFVKNGKTYTFPGVPYLTTRVMNIDSYARSLTLPNGQSSSDQVNYNYEFPAEPNMQAIGDTTRLSDLPRNITLGDYGLYAYGWIDADTASYAARRSPTKRPGLAARSPQLPIGTAGRYYVGSTPGSDNTGASHTLRFTHRLVVNGADVVLDYAGMGSFETALPDPTYLPQTLPTVDFAEGDTVGVNFYGGTLGLPQPGGYALVAIPEPKPRLLDSATGREYSSDLLDQVQVVPNPYLVSQIGQRSNSEHLIYFTHLPEICTIDIYTESGELMQTLHHDANTDPNHRTAVDAWDIITKGNRQAQSQLLIARITTPNGAETIKRFSIVMGGFRVVE